MKILTGIVFGLIPVGILIFLIFDMKTDTDVMVPQNFFAEDKITKNVLANGLIELTERVMVLEKLQNIDPKNKEGK